MKRIAFASGLALCTLICLPGSKLAAGGNEERIPPVTDPVVLKECGSCHIAFQPALLPSQSWRRILDGMRNHFGEDASLSDAAQKRIAAYLTANAAEKDEYREWALRGLGQTDAPLRVTEMPWFLDEHDRHGAFSADKMSYTKAKSKADCKACHRDASQGYYDDIVMPIPAPGGAGAPGLKSMR
jgi:cytochrome c553